MATQQTNKTALTYGADPSGQKAYLWGQGSLQSEVSADLESVCLGTGLGAECGGEDAQIDKQPLTERHMQTNALSTGLIYPK